MKTDLVVFFISEGFLFLLFVFALVGDLSNRRKSKTTSVTAEVKRGEKSMNALYVNFGIATLVFTLIVQTCEALKGNQVLFIVFCASQFDGASSIGWSPCRGAGLQRCGSRKMRVPERCGL